MRQVNRDFTSEYLHTFAERLVLIVPVQIHADTRERTRYDVTSACAVSAPAVVATSASWLSVHIQWDVNRN